MSSDKTPNDTLYHEKQVRQLCAVHALNNLFQEKNAFSKTELDSICYNLSPDNWVNPHKSLLGLGNYDVNVIMSALQSRGFAMVWFDKRKDPSCLNLRNITGLILNVPSDYKIGFVTLPLKGRHWIAIKRVGEIYYNLDSKLDKPALIGNENDLMEFIQSELDVQDKELFVVMPSDIEKSNDWLKGESYYNKVVDSMNRDAEEISIDDVDALT